MKKRMIRTVVCGTRFGQFYLEAIEKSPLFELCGIISHGSEQSNQLAQYYNVPLYEKVSDLPADIELVCVIVKTESFGGAGVKLACEIMNKGISVLIEQPIHQKDFINCYQVATKNKVHFSVANFYVHLPGFRQFNQMVTKLLKEQRLLYIDIDFSTQVSFSLAHMLLILMKSTQIFKIEQVKQENGSPFVQTIAWFGEIPIYIRAHNEIDSEISDRYMLLFHEFIFGFEMGRLSLLDTNGLIIWQPRLQIPQGYRIPLDLRHENIEVMSSQSTMVLGETKIKSWQDTLKQDWIQAIQEELNSIREGILGYHSKQYKKQTAQQLSRVCQLWQSIMQALGFPHAIKGSYHTNNIDKDIRRLYWESQDWDARLSCIDAKGIEKSVEALNQAAYFSMIKFLQEHGALQQKEGKNKLISRIPVIEDKRFILKRWLEALKLAGLIEEVAEEIKPSTYLLELGKVTDEMVEIKWKKALLLWENYLGPGVIIDYFKKHVQKFNELFRGATAVHLLLEEGKSNLAYALYHETAISVSLNLAVARYVKQKVELHESGLKILEIGAGTGATTDVVMESLKKYSDDAISVYWYTDLSEYFLKEAQARYKNDMYFHYQICDIDKSLKEQGIPQDSFDVIIAAGVINNAADIEKTLIQLKDCLTKGGIMLITEAVGEAPIMLISQVFMMKEAQDIRRERNTTFLYMEQWEELFVKMGLVYSYWPEKESKLNPLGQKLFVLRNERIRGKERE